LAPASVLALPGPGPQERKTTVDEHTISSAGDPFYAARHRTDDTIAAHYASLERACSCYGGYHYIGYMVEDPHTGEEVEVFEAVPCKRCKQAK
jgi:hypothetical protein